MGCSGHNRIRQGFTLLELLVAIAILMIIVLIAVQLFSRARTAWDVGSRIADSCLKGRTVADFVAQELSRAVLPTNGSSFTVTATTIDFPILRQVETASDLVVTNEQISFAAGTAMLGTNELCRGLADMTFSSNPGYVPGSELPLYVDVIVRIVSDDGTVTNLYQSRATFPNWDRYRF